LKKNTFDILILIARPAAGKSEIIDYLNKTKYLLRRKRFHISNLEIMDDFPLLWSWFEEDAILSKMGFPRLHTNDKNEFVGPHLWNLLIERLSLEYQKLLRDHPKLHNNHTVMLEFSRGSQHGGYKTAFQHISAEILSRAAILYINVSWEESLRKNRKRFNPEKPDSILEHGLSDEGLEKLYKEVDWEELSETDAKYINVNSVKIPYVVFENEDDVTSPRGSALGERLENCLARLWDLYSV
jgi:hypothetical protein